MPVQYPGDDSEIPADRSDVVIPIPLDEDGGNASTFNVALQPIIDLLQRLWKKAGFLDVASTWAALQTMAGRLVVSRPGGNTNPSLKVVGPAEVDSLTSLGAIEGPSAAIDDEITAGSIAVTNASVTGSLTAPSISGNTTVTGTLTATNIHAGAWVSPGDGSGAAYATGWTTALASFSVRLTPWGEIQFRGSVTPGAGATTAIANLPSSVRPGVDRRFLISSTSGPDGNGICHMRIRSTGLVELVSGFVTPSALYFFDDVRVTI